MAFEFIRKQLDAKSEQGLHRALKTINSDHDAVVEIQGKHYLNFASNDYLGLRQHGDVLQSYAEGLSLYGAGSGASPLVSGHYDACDSLQAALCELVNKPSAVLFSSGFAANQAICQVMLAPSTTSSNDVAIVADKLMHASFIDGCLAHQKQFSRFRHNDVSHAESLLAAAKNENKLLVSEGVFSMDGDQAPIDALVALRNTRQDTWLMLDQAHSFGVVGEDGCGVNNSYDGVDLVMGTFGKALGTQGAFIAGSEEFIDYIKNFARHYIYSTGLSPASAVATLTALQLMQKGSFRQKLDENINTFRRLALGKGIGLSDSITPIQTLILKRPEAVLLAQEKLMELGILVSAIRYPTVPKNTDRLRIAISAQHQYEDLVAIVDALALVSEAMETL
ncbi:aminotransferase class I/II-fold pyridoxal phosphate-dependent enzyme [Glaciecola sp. 1036]|uniref:aminotransferase class I/II-fold pyridoxal phosphate-dependent enzyme n=1 Tax=Alteromonadaceae TaxID=72275 RepID=UPI003D01D01F